MYQQYVKWQFWNGVWRKRGIDKRDVRRLTSFSRNIILRVKVWSIVDIVEVNVIIKNSV